MNITASKSEEQTNKAVANQTVPYYTGERLATAFEDHRPITSQQRELTQIANAHSFVGQLKAGQQLSVENQSSLPKTIQRNTISGLKFETNAPVLEAGDASEVVQRKLDFAYSGGVITRCVFTKRPGWKAEVRHNMPSISGYDRGHLIPWMAVRLEIEFDMTGLNLQQAYDYLENKGHTPTAKTWEAVRKAIGDYGREANSDLDNLEYEDSSDNRSNGAKLPSAAELWQSIHEVNGWEWDPPYEFNGKTIKSKKEAEKECLEVGVPDKSLWPVAKKRFGKGSNCTIM